MSEIRYRVSSVTSEHSRYPARNLTINQQGWQSSINCEYPQALTIQFYIPIRTKKLHLLFHQYKIPRLMEVFIKLGCRGKYRKLGHLIPNDNSQSSFEEKQEKSLYFEFSCTHIRFVFHENYKNDMNIFSQVALQDLIVVGEILNHRQIASIDLGEDDTSEDEAVESIQISHNKSSYQQQERKQHKSLTYPMTSSSPIFRDIYQKLQSQKNDAVSNQQYQKASQIKTILLNFKNLQNDIIRLEKQKADALKRQDYDLCHRIKNEIDKKKEVVQFQRQSLLQNQQRFYSQNIFSSRVVQRQVSPVKTSNKDNISRDISQFKSPQDKLDISIKKSSVINSHDEQVIPALQKNKKKDLQNLPMQTAQKKKQIFADINQSAIQQQIQYQNTSLRKDVNEIQQLTQREEQTSMMNESNIKLQPLDLKLRIRIQNYFDFLPEKIWQLCQNKHWKAKYQALKFIKQKIQQIQTKQQFMGVLEMISRIIVAKQAAVTIQVLTLMNRLTDLNIKFTLQHLPFFVEEIIAAVLNFLNDTNSKIKQLSYMTYLRLPRISFLNISVIIRQLIRHKNKVKNDPKLIITKLQLMTMIVETYREVQYNFKEIMNWTLVYFQDPNQKVRSSASDLLVALTYLVGSQKLLKSIEDMKKPQLLEQVLNMMNSSFEHSKANIDQSKLSLDNSKLKSQFYGDQAAKNKSNIGKVPSLQPIYALESKQKLEQSSKSRRQSDNGNFELSYSRQSMYEQSMQPNNLRKNINDQKDQRQIRVLQEQQISNQEEDFEDNVCIYCLEQYGSDQKTHYLEECKVLAHCDKCNSLIYIRQFTDHLLKQCQQTHLYKMCKKCGIAIQIRQINEHVAKDTCKKKLGVNWQRCQFCSRDVLAQDKFWIQHALQCSSLPEKKYSKPADQQQDISMEVSQ